MIIIVMFTSPLRGLKNIQQIINSNSATNFKIDIERIAQPIMQVPAFAIVYEYVFNN